MIHGYSWLWLTRLKRNRLVNPDGTGNLSLHQVELTETGTVVHLKGYGIVKVFKIVTPNGDIEVNALPEEPDVKHCVDFDY